MIRPDTEIGATLARELAARIGPQRFELWFAEGVRLHVEAQKLHVVAATEFSRVNLHKQFLADLEGVAASLLGPGATVQFAIDPALGRRLKKDASPAVATTTAAAASTETSVSTGPQATTATDTAAASRKRYELAEFAVGEGNRLAHSSVGLALDRTGHVSPLLLHGPCGVGKTHLLEGMAAAARRLRRTRRVVVQTAEQFTTQFVEAVQGKGLPSFRRKFREVELLLIDDIHFLAGKKATIAELVHTLDTLQRAGRQVVLTSDRSPAELAELGGEFAARLSGGLACLVEPADYATRRAIAERFSREAHLCLTPDVLDFVAQHLGGDARELRGAVNRLLAMSQATGEPITLETCRTWLADLMQICQPVVHLAEVERAVCETFGVSADELRSGKKVQRLNQPRMLAMWLARKFTRAGLAEIGDYFGRRSHSTVIAANKNVNRWLADNEEAQLAGRRVFLAEAVRRAESRLRTG